jgi:hypothetical protein
MCHRFSIVRDRPIDYPATGLVTAVEEQFSSISQVGTVDGWGSGSVAFAGCALESSRGVAVSGGVDGFEGRTSCVLGGAVRGACGGVPGGRANQCDNEEHCCVHSECVLRLNNLCAVADIRGVRAWLAAALRDQSSN